MQSYLEPATNLRDALASLTEANHPLYAQKVMFDMAINNMSQGLCFFDGEQRLIVCNTRYAEMYGLPPECTRPGTTLRQIVEARFAVGSCPNMTREEYLAWRDNVAVSNCAS